MLDILVAVILADEIVEIVHEKSLAKIISNRLIQKSLVTT